MLLLVYKHNLEIKCNTLVLTSFALNVYDVYIVINHGVELKAKAPPSIWLCYVWRLKMLSMIYRDIRHITVLASCKYAFLIKMNPNQLCQWNHDEKGMIFLRIRRGNC